MYSAELPNTSTFFLFRQVVFHDSLTHPIRPAPICSLLLRRVCTTYGLPYAASRSTRYLLLANLVLVGVVPAGIVRAVGVLVGYRKYRTIRNSSHYFFGRGGGMRRPQSHLRFSVHAGIESVWPLVCLQLVISSYTHRDQCASRLSLPKPPDILDNLVLPLL